LSTQSFTRRLSQLTLILSAVLFLTAWAPDPAHAGGGDAGAVYTLTNDAVQNSVLVYDRAADGALTYRGAVATGGQGGAVSAQGALTLTDNGKWLFAVNAGSGTISAFDARHGDLALVGAFPSGGAQPISITVDHDLLYVLNFGSSAIHGFTIGHDGALVPLAGSARPLSPGAAGAKQIGFTPDGRVLIVAENNSNSIDTYTVGKDGLASGPTSFASGAAAPFGFGFDNKGRLMVSHSASSSVSSFDVGKDGTLTLLSNVPDAQGAACWIAVTKNGKYVYTANAAAGNVSGYGVAHDGTLSLLPLPGGLGVTGGGPLDMAFSVNSQLLYVLNRATQRINAFAVAGDGSLANLADTPIAAPAGVGIAAR